MKQWVFVDRVESGRAVLTPESGGASFDVPASWLPPGVGEGRWLSLALEPDPAKDKAMVEHTRQLRGKLAKGDDGGDLKL
jgi:hypothetical protein